MQPVSLRPYRANPECPKCGHDQFDWHHLKGFSGSSTDPVEPDRLNLCCKRCRFIVHMTPKDDAGAATVQWSAG